MFRPEGVQPKLAVIFRGQGLIISEDENKVWHQVVDVYFQTNAWMDQRVCKCWCDKTLLPFIKEGLSKFVLLLDNLKGQMQDDFKDAVAGANGFLWYGLPSATDLWQPVDAGYVASLKALIAIEHRKWLDIDNNSDRWFGNEQPYSAKERRILITHWAGDAWKVLSTAKYDKQRHKCWTMTGCLITADGSDDSLIKPEGLDDYVVPPPSVVDPSLEPSKGIENDVQPMDIDTDMIDDNDGLLEITDDVMFFAPEEDDVERNLFDFTDNLVC